MSIHVIKRIDAITEAAAAQIGLLPIAREVNWLMRSPDTPHNELVGLAMDAGFPVQHLPLPVSAEVAFTYATAAACANVPERLGKWRSDIPKNLRTDATITAVIQKQRPRTNGDTRKYIWQEEFKFILVRPVIMDGEVLSPAAILADRSINDEQAVICERIQAQYSRRINNACADEIRESAEAALTDAGAVKIAPRQWLCMGPAMYTALSVASWLDSLGNNTAGTKVYWNLGNDMDEAARFVTEGLRGEVEAIVAKVKESLDGDDTAAQTLRARFGDILALTQRVSSYQEVLGSVADTLNSRIEASRKMIEQAAGDVELEQDISTEAVDGLRTALEGLLVAVRAKDGAALTDAIAGLRDNETTARQANFGRLWKRLRQHAERVDTEDTEDMMFDGIEAMATGVAQFAGEALADDGMLDL